jgi:hypothetical protein
VKPEYIQYQAESVARAKLPAVKRHSKPVKTTAKTTIRGRRMNEQYLQYVREEIALATADFSGRTKGQLVALVEQLQFTHERYPRKRQFIVDEVTGKKIMLRNPPVPGKQSHAKGTSIPRSSRWSFQPQAGAAL